MNVGQTVTKLMAYVSLLPDEWDKVIQTID